MFTDSEAAWLEGCDARTEADRRDETCGLTTPAPFPASHGHLPPF